MKIPKDKKRKKVIIKPGEYYVSNKDIVMSTLLGSCVSVCLYDPVCKVMGMNHFLLTNKGIEDTLECSLDQGRQGLCAMDLLIHDMLKLGAKKQNLKAKAFGGGSMFKPFDECMINYCVGKSNIDFVKKYLQNNQIGLVNCDLGGEKGRLILFSFGDFYVYVKKITKNNSTKLIPRDKKYWYTIVQKEE